MSTPTARTSGISYWFNTLPDYLRRTVRTFVAVFLGLFLVSLTGWLQELQTWASCIEEACQAFPDPSVLVKAAIAAAGSAFSAAITLVWNYLEDKTRVVPSLLKDNPTVEQAPNRFPNEDRTQREMLPRGRYADLPASTVTQSGDE